MIRLKEDIEGKYMKEIPLTNGLVSTVDDCDYTLLSQYRWYAGKSKQTYYAMRQTRMFSGQNGQRTSRMHHVIMGKPIGGLQIDHIDGNGLNNCRTNLRLVTSRENSQNYHIKKTSKYPGVSRMSRDGTWVARINWDKASVRTLGYFITEEEAYRIYCIACENIGVIKAVAPTLEKGTFPFWFRRTFCGVCC